VSATPWTAGPWVGHPYDGLVGRNQQRVLFAAFRAGLVSTDQNPEAVANTRLAYAAPEMAEALEQTAAAMDALHPSAAGDMNDADYARLWNSTREALDAILFRIRGDAT